MSRPLARHALLQSSLFRPRHSDPPHGWSMLTSGLRGAHVPTGECAVPRGTPAAAPVVRASAAGAKRKMGFAQLLPRKGPASQRLVPKKPLVKGVVSPRRAVPAGIPRPPYAESGVAPGWNDDYQIQDAEGIQRMRAAGQLAARIRDHAGTLVKPGVTTDEIDEVVHQMILDAGAYPSPLNYGKFPKSVCTSVNECVCHGIPDSRPLEDGDIVNIDVTVFLNVTEEALAAAIAICKPGVEFKQIGSVIHALADKHNYGVVKQFVGHGVGRIFHTGPTVIHCRNNQPGRMCVGQTFTIEPMLTAGGADVELWDDDWTAVTADGCLSAQFEHTLLIVEDGVEVLTPSS